MFGLFKKKESKAQEQTPPTLTLEATANIQAEIDQIQQVISSTQEPQRLAELYEQVGLKYAELNENDQAISYLEKSLAEKKSMGVGYKQLMLLYNKKRAAAARAGDDQGIDYYMKKMDEMRQIAKQLTINGNK
jgi:tetratricopeptide (TPR) repeat protein